MISNYYEPLVLDKIKELLAATDKTNDNGYIADAACVALNQLPPRYVRHSIDTSFYMTPAENNHIAVIVNSAVINAIDFIDERLDSRPDGSASKRDHDQAR